MNLREFIKLNNLSPSTVARKTGISRQWLYILMDRNEVFEDYIDRLKFVYKDLKGIDEIDTIPKTMYLDINENGTYIYPTEKAERVKFTSEEREKILENEKQFTKYMISKVKNNELVSKKIHDKIVSKVR